LNIHLENINLSSNTGPNSFANKLVKYKPEQITFDAQKEYDAILCFIESQRKEAKKPLFLRMDGIYINTKQNYVMQNKNILRTYKMSSGIIFQSFFGKKLIEQTFGSHNNSIIIPNGADTTSIVKTKELQLNKYENLWSCAANWRPHKRLDENIRYFLENSSKNDGLIIAGAVPFDLRVRHERIHYAGKLNQNQLFSLYKKSKYFIHLSRYESCPNVVIDARAAGCKIICSSIAGTKEVAGPDAIVIYEEPWDYSPASTTNLPNISFDKVVKNCYNTNIDMSNVSKKYENFLKETINASTKTN